MRFIATVSALIILNGCATVKNNYVPRTEQVSFPSLEVEQTAMLGDDLVRQGTATSTQGVYLPQENNVGGFRLSKGFYPKTGEDEKHVFTSFAINQAPTGVGRVSISRGLFGQNVYPSGIRFDKSEQKTCVIAPNGYGFNQPVCDTEYPFQFTERPFLTDNNFQQTLIYSGRVGDRIKISYREFSGNIARAAFSNEAEYDLKESNIIAYKGARIEVLEANNERIRYIVKSNFNTQ